MKVGILTFHNVINYGAVLQCFALQELIKSMGVEVQIINYAPQKISAIYKPFNISKYKLHAKKSLKILLRSIASDFIHYKYLLKKNKSFYDFYNKYYNISGYPCKTPKQLKHLNLDYDVCFAGSDQIWNPDITNGFDSIYFLNFGKKSMVRASYAASIGRDNFSEEEKGQLIELLSAFDAISMREKTAAELLRKYFNFSPTVVLDPTLLICAEAWKKLLPISSETKEKYIFVYTLYSNPEINNFVDRLSNDKKLKVITINPRKSYSNEVEPHFFANPAEFIHLIANAEYVVTNSFHGTALSVNFSKNFFCFMSIARNSRITDLLDMLGISNRAVKCFDENMITMTDIDYSSVQTILKQERERSVEYIKNVLKKAE